MLCVALMIGATSGYDACVRELLARGANPHVQSKVTQFNTVLIDTFLAQLEAHPLNNKTNYQLYLLVFCCCHLTAQCGYCKVNCDPCKVVRDEWMLTSCDVRVPHSLRDRASSVSCTLSPFITPTR
jgi:hypothetical protein